MVVFQCEGCGEAVKKPKAVKHVQQCRYFNGYSCIDCQKFFSDDSYTQHTSCVTEEQKYKHGYRNNPPASKTKPPTPSNIDTEKKSSEGLDSSNKKQKRQEKKSSDGLDSSNKKRKRQKEQNDEPTKHQRLMDNPTEPAILVQGTPALTLSKTAARRRLHLHWKARIKKILKEAPGKTMSYQDLKLAVIPLIMKEARVQLEGVFDQRLPSCNVILEGNLVKLKS